MFFTKAIQIISPFFCLIIFSCSSLIKNEDAKIVIEEGTKPLDSLIIETTKENSTLGSYVGMFEADIDDSIKWSKTITAGEAFYWTRENKISICIDSIGTKIIKGHSVVAGNETFFEGTFKKEGLIFYVQAKELGNNKTNGVFNFSIKDSAIDGTWKSFAKIEISQRKYNLLKREFKYNPHQLLEANKRFVDWTKPELSKEELTKIKSKMQSTELAEFEEFEESTNFASATKNIYTLNASDALISEKIVSNLSKGDLSILRNTIYARHGYSFKNRPLRVFFDRQNWYIPVYANIKNAFTEIEKKNIELLLKYEKVAKEYYDYFGRG